MVNFREWVLVKDMDVDMGRASIASESNRGFIASKEKFDVEMGNKYGKDHRGGNINVPCILQKLDYSGIDDGNMKKKRNNNNLSGGGFNDNNLKKGTKAAEEKTSSDDHRERMSSSDLGSVNSSTNGNEKKTTHQQYFQCNWTPSIHH